MVRTPVRAPHEKAEETQVLGRKRSQLDAASWVLAASCFEQGCPGPTRVLPKRQSQSLAWLPCRREPGVAQRRPLPSHCRVL